MLFPSWETENMKLCCIMENNKMHNNMVVLNFYKALIRIEQQQSSTCFTTSVLERYKRQGNGEALL